MALLSDRAGKTSSVVVMPSSLDDPSKSPPGIYRVGVFLACAAVFAFFAALVVAFYWRAHDRAYWRVLPLPRMLWVSTNLILASSLTFEIARRLWRHGEHRLAQRYLLGTACLGTAFLASQLTAWRELVRAGAYLSQNPFNSFFYLFTGLHGAHLVGGLIALFIVVAGRSKRRELIDAVCYYWHFLGALWIALFAVLFYA
jgi:cytochrome c oxidase subunit III